MKIKCSSCCKQYFLFLILWSSSFTICWSQVPDESNLRLEGKEYEPSSLVELLESQTNLKVIYDPSIFPAVLKYDWGEVTSLDILFEIFERKFNISPKQIENSIYLKRIIEREVQGKVFDKETNEVLVGATVQVMESNLGTITNINGEFSFVISENDNRNDLKISYVGFLEQVVTVEYNKPLKIFLEPKAQNLDEIVVVGYGSQKKSNVTGAISKIDSEVFERSTNTSPIHAIQGLASGIDVISQSFASGNEPVVRIRGERSILASNDPLIILDGIPYQGSINDINPIEVSSIEILKDASSTAIYGSRAANGVLLITTKRGGEDGLTIELNTFYGITEPANKIDMMDRIEFIQFRREAERARFLLDELPPIEEPTFAPFELDRIARAESTDWQDELYGQGSIQSINVGIGGVIDGKKQYFFSAGYLNEQYPIENVDFTRYNLRVNFDTKPSDKLSFGSSTFFSHSISNQGGFGGTDGLDQVYRTDPLSLAEDEMGNPLFQTSEDPLRFNPLFNTNRDNYIDESLTTRVFPSFFFQVDIIPSLSYKLNFGGDIRFTTSNRFRGLYSTPNGLPQSEIDALLADGETINDVRIINRKTLGFTLENVVTHAFKVEEHDFNNTFLFSIQDSDQTTATMSASQLNQAPEVTFFGIDDAVQFPEVDNQKVASQLMSGMARFNYKFRDTYLVTLTGRADGSSVLAEGNKWAFFPSGAVAWNIHNEPFFNTQRIVSDLKVRISYGITGNQAIDPYDSQAGLQGTDYYFGELDGSGFSTTSIANSDLRWEKTSQWDIGLDFALLNGRIQSSIDYYRSTTTDLLFERRIPFVTGFESIVSNIGSTKNKGIEIAISSTVINSNKFNWNLNVNVARNEGEITDLFGDNETDDIGNNLFIGNPIRVFYDNVFEGIWQLDEEDAARELGFRPGDIKLADINNDGLINDNDRQILGSQIPEWIGGLSSTWKYVGFDLNLIVNARLNYMAKNEFKERYNTLESRDGNVSIDYWTPENPSNIAPRPNRDDRPDNLRVLTYEEASFVRVRQISLGYTPPAKIMDKMSMKSIRIYFTVMNPFLFTDFEGMDPEQPTFSEDRTKFAQAANLRQFISGINLKF